MSKFNLKTCKISNCNRCDISINRNSIVNGYGNLHSGIIFIGEAPGYYEDKLGIPFVGKSGRLFSEMLDLIGLTRDDIYVTNIIKCKPFNNRNPLAVEVRNCKDYLIGELWVGKPRIIILMGNVALNSYFNTRNLTISSLAGQVITHKGIKIITIYHPSYILRNMGSVKIVKSYINSFKKIGLLYRYLINPLITMKI